MQHVLSGCYAQANRQSQRDSRYNGVCRYIKFNLKMFNAVMALSYERLGCTLLSGDSIAESETVKFKSCIFLFDVEIVFFDRIARFGNFQR